MARSKPSARDALLKVQQQREQLAIEEAALRESVAAELGKVMLDCGFEAIEPAQLKQLLLAVRDLGIEQATKRLSAN
jgi:predicted component of type VI protein secretion system